MIRRKVGFVIGRLSDINQGGQEVYAQKLAQKLAPYWDIEFLTSCSNSYHTWSMDYEPGLSTSSNGYKIRRFQQSPSNPEKIVLSSNLAFSNPYIPGSDLSMLKEMGPWMPELPLYLQQNRDNYDFFLFFGYLWATSIFGTAPVADRSILVPMAHNEPYLYFPVYRQLFHSIPGIVFHTPEDMLLVQKVHGPLSADWDIMGFGIDSISTTQPDLFKTTFNINNPYLLYIGRINNAKGCSELLKMFNSFRSRLPEQVTLVFIGEPEDQMHEIPEGVLITGYVDEEMKQSAISGALALINPSQKESLSIVLLESWAQGTPVLVNAYCEVTRAQVLRSGGGTWYHDSQDLGNHVSQLLTNPDQKKIWSEKGLEYIRSSMCNWEEITRKYWLFGESLFWKNRSRSHPENLLKHYLNQYGGCLNR